LKELGVVERSEVGTLAFTGRLMERLLWGE
jgi:hypothetical protein